MSHRRQVGPGGVNLARIALLGQQGQMSAVVDVGVGQQHAVDLLHRMGRGWFSIDVLALLHAAVDQNVQPPVSSRVQLPVTSWVCA